MVRTGVGPNMRSDQVLVVRQRGGVTPSSQNNLVQKSTVVSMAKESESIPFYNTDIGVPPSPVLTTVHKQWSIQMLGGGESANLSYPLFIVDRTKAASTRGSTTRGGMTWDMLQKKVQPINPE